MTHRKLSALMLALLLGVTMAACNGDNGNGEDADGDGDVVEEEDITTDDIRVDDVPADDVTVDDVPVDDVTVDEDVPPDTPAEETPGECVDVVVSCGDSLSGESTVGVVDSMNEYSCAAGLDESGGERVYSISTTTNQRVTVAITTAAEDLDLFILTGECDPATCIEYGAASGTTDSATFTAEGGSTYYIVVDGFDGSADTFDISFTCAEAEICDDGIDNNGNGLIDCFDAECAGTTTCTEDVCDDGTDNDHDSLVDCDDRDCAEADNCYESSCTDTVDNDGDGDVDCDDIDCLLGGECAGGAGLVGDPCDNLEDCESGQCFYEWGSGWPEGYCLVLTYDEDCSTLVCPAGSMCVSFGFFGPYGCLEECTVDGDCRTNYQCYDTDDDTTGDICVPNCTDNAHCPTTGLCNTESGYCAIPPEICTGGVDEDDDGDIDCLDSDCAFSPDCVTVTDLDGGEDCDSVVALTLPDGERGQVIVSGTTTGAADDIEPSCMGTGTPDKLYSFTLTAPAFVTVDVMGGPDAPLHTDTGLSVRIDCDAGPDILCNDDWDAFYHSRVFASLAAGTYHIVIDGYDGIAGDYTLSVVLADLP